MGSYSNLLINGYPICTTKNGYDETVVRLLFQADDFLSEVRSNSSRNPLVWGDDYKDDLREYQFFGFRQTVKNCLRRLEIYGMSLKKAKADFLQARKLAQEESCVYDFSILRVSFGAYLAELKYILDNKLIQYDQLHGNLRDSLLSDELGIYGQSASAYLYCLLSTLPEDSYVEYDLTDVVEGGWVSENDLLRINFERIIILTEGKTDSEFIRGAMKLLNPELIPYYHFIDFNEYKMESNASALGKLVMSFAAASVSHPMIAIFDNDTVGNMEMNRVDRSNLPNNIKVIRLPDIALAKRYPTIGPTGLKKMNVNGMACGIEMFLGEDVLLDGSRLMPVLWKGYIDREGKYQGELQNKMLVQEKFRAKLKSGLTRHMDCMNQVLEKIFTAFY